MMTPLRGREIVHVTEAGDDLVALLEERVVHEPQVSVGDELLLVVLEDERSDLASEVREQRLSLDLDEERRLEGVHVHPPGYCWDHRLCGLQR